MVTGGKVNGAFHEPSGGRKRGGGTNLNLLNKI